MNEVQACEDKPTGSSFLKCTPMYSLDMRIEDCAENSHLCYCHLIQMKIFFPSNLMLNIRLLNVTNLIKCFDVIYAGG